ncbi:hypothetical protein E5288_WYG020050 [Bos mutus]|uniref:GOLD domain-containing protein n=1 Tax=Bos mutus TaxID=72004 RepID=A0A6B0SAV5_9CETA|nr:hypothetical protein [Bos mutus]
MSSTSDPLTIVSATDFCPQQSPLISGTELKQPPVTRSSRPTPVGDRSPCEPAPGQPADRPKSLRKLCLLSCQHGAPKGPGKHTFQMLKGGDLRAIWSNLDLKRIHLDIRVGEHDLDAAITQAKDKVNEVSFKLEHLIEQIEQIVKEQNYQRDREEKFRMTSEDTNSNVLWWAFTQTLIFISVGIFQMKSLKDFFIAKKLVKTFHMPMPEASKALAPPGPSSPCDQGSRPLTSCSSDPTGPSWPRASPLPPPVCSPQGPSPFPTTTTTEQGPRDRSAQRSALKAGTRPVSLWPPPPFARALPPVRPRPPGGSLRLGSLGAPTSAPPGGPHGSGSTTRRSAGVSAAETTRRRQSGILTPSLPASLTGEESEHHSPPRPQTLWRKWRPSAWAAVSGGPAGARLTPHSSPRGPVSGPLPSGPSVHACPSRPFPSQPAPAWRVSQLAAHPRAPPGSVSTSGGATGPRVLGSQVLGVGGQRRVPSGLAESRSWQPEDVGRGQAALREEAEPSTARRVGAEQPPRLDRSRAHVGQT